MFSVKPCSLPKEALLNTYTEKGAYIDCYRTEITGNATLEQYVYAFYTTKLFKLERLILKWTVSRPSSDTQAKQLAEGTIDNFAAWQVESKDKNQLLMSDMITRTRSWFMIILDSDDLSNKTQLYFGSAIVRVKNTRTGKKSLGPVFTLLLGFHKVYSRALLCSARSRLKVQLHLD